MTRLKNSQGFSAVGVLLILVIVGILGFTGWFVYHSQKVANKDYASKPSAQVTTTKKATKPVDLYAGWKQYCSDAGNACYKYPAAWTASSLETQDPSIMGQTLTSSSKTTLVSYSPVIGGLGGACEPGVCSFDMISMDTPSDASAQNLRIVKGVFESRDSGYVATPMYCVTDASFVTQVGLKLGEQDFGLLYLNFHNPHKDQIENLCVTSSTPTVHPTSLKAAQDWLSSTDVIEAGKVLNSIQLK